MARRAMTNKRARQVRSAGLDAEKEFARLIGGIVFSSSGKRDVIDRGGDMHSVKSGDKKCKNKNKNKLKKAMINLKNYLSLKFNKKNFLKKAFLSNGEVKYLTIKENEIFHIFDGNQVINVIDKSTYLENSKKTKKGDFDSQKVVFKLNDSNITIGEIEMRNDSNIHYRQIKYWMSRDKTLELLKEKITKKKMHSLILYGEARNGRFMLD